MTDLSPRKLMMIEPSRPAALPIEDELTALARAVWARAERSPDGYRGFHVCVCGERSDNRDHYLTDRPGDFAGRGAVLTNSLLVHYVSRHREELLDRWPGEVEKLRAAGRRLGVSG